MFETNYTATYYQYENNDKDKHNWHRSIIFPAGGIKTDMSR